MYHIGHYLREEVLPDKDEGKSRLRRLHLHSSVFFQGYIAPRSRVLDLAPSVGTRGSELDHGPAPGVKVWCLGEALSPAPGDPELLSAFNADSHSARAAALTSRRKPGYRSIPIRTTRNKYNRMDFLHWSVRRNPGEICLTDHRFNQFFSC